MDFLCDYVNGLNRSDSKSLLSAASQTRNISGISAANPAVVTVTASHAWDDGDIIYITGTSGSTWANAQYYQITVLTATTFELQDLNGNNIDSTALAAWTSGGTAIRYSITRTNPVRIQVDDHGYEVGQEFFLSGAAAPTNLNNTYQTVGVVRGVNCIELTGIDASAWSFYSSGGTLETQWKLVTNVSNAAVAVVSCKAHGFTNGQKVFFPEAVVSGMTELGQKTFTVANATADTFELSGVNSTAWGTFSGTSLCTWIRKESWAGGSHNVYNDMKPGDILKVLECGTVTQLTAADCTWAYGTNTINTSASLAADINVGDFLCRNPATGLNGGPDGSHEVTGRTGVQITIRHNYGGTSGTDTASIYRVRPLGIGVSAQSLFSTTVSGESSGGWVIADNTIPARTGYTCIQHTVNRTTSTHNGFASSNNNPSYFNIFYCYRNLYLTGSGMSYSNMTCVAANIYGVDLTGNNSQGEDSYFGAQDGSTQPTIYAISSQGHTFDNVYAQPPRTGSAYAFQANLANSTHDLDGLIIRGGGNGINLIAASITLINPTVARCFPAINIGASANNAIIIDPTFEDIVGTHAMNIGTLVNSLTIINPQFTGPSYPTYAMNVSQSNGIKIYGGNFGNCGYVALLDQYSGKLHMVGSHLGNPTVRAFDKNGNSTEVILESCTIDDAALYKVLVVPAGTGNNDPHFIVLDSFQGVTGKFYSNHNITRISDNPPYLVFQITNVSNYLYIDYPVISTQVKRGENFEIDFEIARLSASAFSGAIETVIRLNGVEITSGITGNGDITSISQFDTWDAKNITVSGAQITRDGELTIGWKFAANSSITPIALRINP